MTYLLDGNVIFSLALPNHVHHQRVLKWFKTIHQFATCGVTEGTLLRLHMQQARDKSATAAWTTLRAYHANPKHQFWAENFSCLEFPPTRLTAHKQITDTWLAELARRKGGKLATLDEGLAVLWPESTQLIPF